MSRFTRRTVLQKGIFGCIVPLSAGCLAQDALVHEKTTRTPTAGWMEIQNVTDSTVSVSLTVTDAESGDSVFDERVSLDPSGHAGFEDVFPEYRRYEVTVTVSDSRSKTQTVTYASNSWTGWSIVVRASEIAMNGVAP